MNFNLNYKNEQKIYDEVVEAGVPFLKFPLLEETGKVNHGFSTRLGGVSEGCFSSMNLSFGRNDDKEKVMENYKRMAKAVGTDVDHMVCTMQTHTTNVRIVTKEDCGKGIVKERDYQDVDGLITDVPGICLVSLYADCVPLLFVDPVKNVVATSHSGWRGTVGKMGQVTVDKMVSEFGCCRSDIRAAIGPSICQDCYEVSEDVIEEFAHAFSSDHHKELFYKKDNGKYQLNLWKANEIILIDAGILPKNLAVNNLCTCCNPDVLFSHRASKGKRGNLAAFIALKEE